MESVCGVGLVCWAGVCELGWAGLVCWAGVRVERGLCPGRECAGLWRLGWGAWAADADPGLFPNDRLGPRPRLERCCRRHLTLPLVRRARCDLTRQVCSFVVPWACKREGKATSLVLPSLSAGRCVLQVIVRRTGLDPSVFARCLCFCKQRPAFSKRTRACAKKSAVYPWNAAHKMWHPLRVLLTNVLTKSTRRPF